MSTFLALRTICGTLRYAAAPCQKSLNFRKPPYAIATFFHANRMTGTAANSTTTQKTSTPPPLQDEWRIIYRLPLIRLASAFNRVKILYGGLNAIAIPAVFAMEQGSQLPLETGSVFCAVGITSWLTLAICSFATKNLVGIMYINDANDKMKLAYVDYWGKRCDVVLELDDLIPESEKDKPSKFDFYQTLRFYSNEKLKFKLLQRYGSIEDPETFVAIFGE